MEKNDISGIILEMAKKKEIEITNTSNLFDLGVLDSLNIVILLTQLDEQLNLKIPFEQLDFQSFQSIESIQSLINQLVEGHCE